MAGMLSELPKEAEIGVGKPDGRMVRMVDFEGMPEVAGPKEMVREEVNVKSPGVVGGSRDFDGERCVMFGEVRAG